MRCRTDAWNAHETELRRLLRHRARSEAEGDDLLQEVFLRATRRPNGHIDSGCIHFGFGSSSLMRQISTVRLN